MSGSPGRGTRVNVTGTIPTAWTLADSDVTVTPNEGDPVPAEVRGRFFVARNVPLQDGDNTLVASTTATTLAGNEPTSDTVEDVEPDTSFDQEYTYNANGDLTQKTEDVNGTTIQWDYTYSVDGWLTKVKKKVGAQSVLVEEYWYDPIGRKYKISTTENQQTTTRYFVHDGSSIVVELEKNGDYYFLQKEHVRGPSLGGGIGGLLYTRDAEGTTGYFHYDGQGNAVSVTNEAQEEIAYYEYDAWGNILTACGSLANEFAFSTKQASLGTGLIDFGYRWYDPQTGRWTQRDPIGIAGGLNLYAFCGSNPVNSIDPYGLDFFSDAWDWVNTNILGGYSDGTPDLTLLEAAWDCTLFPNLMPALDHTLRPDLYACGESAPPGWGPKPGEPGGPPEGYTWVPNENWDPNDVNQRPGHYESPGGRETWEPHRRGQDNTDHPDHYDVKRNGKKVRKVPWPEPALPPSLPEIDAPAEAVVVVVIVVVVCWLLGAPVTAPAY